MSVQQESQRLSFLVFAFQDLAGDVSRWVIGAVHGFYKI
jgi:hypothetical protein